MFYVMLAVTQVQSVAAFDISGTIKSRSEGSAVAAIVMIETGAFVRRAPKIMREVLRFANITAGV